MNDQYIDKLKTVIASHLNKMTISIQMLVLWLTLVTYAGLSSILAQDSAASHVGSEKKQEEKKKQDLGNWWERNAASYEPIPAQWLFHLEGTLSYQHLSGNSSGNIFNGTSRLVLRKNRLSTYLTYRHMLQDVSYGGGSGSVDLERHNLIGVLRYDINKQFYIAGGGVKTRDDPFNIANRQIFYGGAGMIYAPKPSHIFGSLAAFGFHRSRYALSGSRIEQTGTAPYVEASWIWTIAPKISFSTIADYLQYQEKSTTNRGNGRSADLTLSLDFRFTKHIALSFGNNFRYEDNLVVRLSHAQKKDNAALIGVKFSY